jgi:truncated hemoglobin YjbI
MNTNQNNEILAHSIGLSRIAMVVDKFYDQVQADPKLVEPLGVVGDWGSHKARLTYFWWVMLGGRSVREVSFQVVRKPAKPGFSPELLRHWVALFRQAALSVVGSELTEAWMDRVSRLSQTLIIGHVQYQANLSLERNKMAA